MSIEAVDADVILSESDLILVSLFLFLLNGTAALRSLLLGIRKHAHARIAASSDIRVVRVDTTPTTALTTFSSMLHVRSKGLGLFGIVASVGTRVVTLGCPFRRLPSFETIGAVHGVDGFERDAGGFVEEEEDKDRCGEIAAGENEAVGVA